MASTAEVLLTLWEQGWPSRSGGGAGPRLKDESRAACRALRGYARRFPLGRPHAALWSASCSWLVGRRREAERSWARTIALAEDLGTPYELARAHFSLGLKLKASRPKREQHLVRAADVFAAYGCADEEKAARLALEQRLSDD